MDRKDESCSKISLKNTDDEKDKYTIFTAAYSYNYGSIFLCARVMPKHKPKIHWSDISVNEEAGNVHTSFFLCSGNNGMFVSCVQNETAYFN